MAKVCNLCEVGMNEFKPCAKHAQRPAILCRFGKRHVLAVRANGTAYCIECLKEAE